MTGFDKALATMMTFFILTPKVHSPRNSSEATWSCLMVVEVLLLPVEITAKMDENYLEKDATQSSSSFK